MNCVLGLRALWAFLCCGLTYAQFNKPANVGCVAEPVPGDCVLGPGETLLTANWTARIIIIPDGSILRFYDYGVGSTIEITAAMIVIDGQLIIGDSGNPYSGDALLTLRRGGESSVPFGDRLPSWPNAHYSSYNLNINFLPVSYTTMKALIVRPGGSLDLHGTPKRSWTRAVHSVSAGSDYLCVLEETHLLRWSKGDAIVVAATDYSGFLDSEEFMVSDVLGIHEDCKGATKVQLNATVKIDKYGDAIKHGYDQRMRAEVGVLTRNIVIQGDPTDDETDGVNPFQGFGGHCIFLYKTTIHIDNVEFRSMGQLNHLARYPLHWHLSGDASGSYVRSSSIHHSFQRCVTIHGTVNGPELSDNLCYDIPGNAVYLENAMETNVPISRNLVMKVNDGTVICSDNCFGGYTVEENGLLSIAFDTQASNGPACFYMTHPSNHLVDNVCASVGRDHQRGLGYWFALPQYVLEPAYTFFNTELTANGVTQKLNRWLGVDDWVTDLRGDPSRGSVLTFRGNVAHSVMTGFKADGIIRSADMNPGTCVRESYGAWKADDGNLFEDFLCYQCQLGAWINAGNSVFNRSTFIDNLRGIYVEKTDTSQFTLASRDLIPDCYEQSSFTELEPDFVYFNANEPEQPGPFLEMIDTHFIANSPNKPPYGAGIGCVWFDLPGSFDCESFGQVGVMVSMGYVFFNGVTVDGYVNDGEFKRGLFGHKEDPGYNAGPFYVSGVKLNGGSNPVYMDPGGPVGMDVRDKAGARNFQLYNPDGSLLPDTSQGQYVTVVPNTPSAMEAKSCDCDGSRYGFACMCIGHVPMVLTAITTDGSKVQGFPGNALRSDPTVAEPTCPSGRTTVNSQWGAQHGCMLDSTVYLSGSDVNNKAPQQWYSTESLMMSAVNGSTVTHIAVLNAGVTDIDVGFNLVQFAAHFDEIGKGEYVVIGVKFPRSPSSVSLNSLTAYIDGNNHVNATFQAPECPSWATCCPKARPAPVYHTILEPTWYRGSGAFPTEFLPVQAYSWGDLLTHNFAYFLDGDVVWTKQTWVIDRLVSGVNKEATRGSQEGATLLQQDPFMSLHMTFPVEVATIVV